MSTCQRREIRWVAGVLLLTAGITGVSHAQTVPDFNYGEALQKSMFFYEAQRSGALPDSNRINWRGDSALHDGESEGVDLTGGWYDAGDHVKFGFPMAGSVTLLAWGAIEYQDAYQSSGQMPFLLGNLRWATDYLLKASDTPDQLWGQVGTGAEDHQWWGPAEVLPTARPAFRITRDCPGSDLAGETAAALAAASIVFRANGDSEYADRLLARAKPLYEFADTYRGRYSDCIADAAQFYRSYSGYMDELVWGAAWLYRASNDPAYLQHATELYASLANQPGSSDKAYSWTHSWDDKSYGSYVLMAELTGGAGYRADVEHWLDYWTAGYNGQRVRYTPGGLAWLDQWGSLRYSANTAFLAFVYSDWLTGQNSSPDKAERYRAFALSQIRYALGDKPRHSSYVVGFGENPPLNPHHRTAHGSWANDINTPTETSHILYGALVGGPDAEDNYQDLRTDYYKNEVALDYNAAFSGALARAFREFGGKPLDNFPQPEIPSRDELFVEASVNSLGSNYVDLAIALNNRTAWPARRTDALSFRYFLMLPSGAPADVTLSGGGCTFSPPAAWSGPVYYIQADCPQLALYPGGQDASRRIVQLRITRRTALDASNDWSFTDLGGAGSQPVKTSHISLYNNGERVWGSEPDRGTPASLTLVADTPPSTAVAGQPYTFALSASGGFPPYKLWSVQSGTLPTGITLNETSGQLTGTPIEDGSFSFEVQVTDAAGATGSAQLQLTVDPPLPLAVSSTPLPAGYVGLVYRAPLAATGGIPPFTWKVEGDLPAGILLNGGYLLGIPLVAGETPVGLTVSDGRGVSAQAPAALKVTAAPVSTGKLRLEYKNLFSNPTGNQVGPQFRIRNTGTEPVNLSELEIRYYFRYSGPQTLTNWCDWAAFGCANVIATFVDDGLGNFHLSDRFGPDSGPIAPGQTAEIQNRFAKSDWSPFDQSGDYSFDPTRTDFSEWQNVTLYRNGVLIWGKEPGK